MNEQTQEQIDRLIADIHKFSKAAYHTGWIYIGGAAIQFALWGWTIARHGHWAAQLFNAGFGILSLILAYKRIKRIEKYNQLIHELILLKGAAARGSDIAFDHHLDQVKARVNVL